MVHLHSFFFHLAPSPPPLQAGTAKQQPPHDPCGSALDFPFPPPAFLLFCLSPRAFNPSACPCDSSVFVAFYFFSTLHSLSPDLGFPFSPFGTTDTCDLFLGAPISFLLFSLPLSSSGPSDVAFLRASFCLYQASSRHLPGPPKLFSPTPGPCDEHPPPCFK